MSAEQFPDIEILPQQIPEKKPENSYRIFLIGDQTLCSAFPDINKQQLIEDFKDSQGKTYDIVQLAVPLSNSFAVQRLACCVNRLDPDACVIVTGANEFYGIPRKSAWMQDINDYQGLSWYVRMKNHRFIQLLERFIYTKKESPVEFPPTSLDDWIIDLNSDQYDESLNYFDKNIKKITKKVKCPTFMVSMPSNIKQEPYRSYFADKELKDEDFVKECGVLVANADRFTIDRWIDDLQAWEPETAVYYYCKAMISEGEGDKDGALTYYDKALELDAFRVRFSYDMYETIVKYADGENIKLVDLYSKSKQLSEQGLKINQYFTDGLTLNQRGRELFISEIKSELIKHFNQ